MLVRQKHVYVLDMKWLIRPWLRFSFLRVIEEKATEEESSTTSCPFLQPLIKSINLLLLEDLFKFTAWQLCTTDLIVDAHF